jgi:dethiobiotin synthetase
VDVLLVEGAGGLLVPLAGTTTFLDLAVRARLPVLIVAANRLGTVNHTALTARVARAAGLDVVGFVLSQPSATTDPSAESNAATIAALTAVPCLGTLPHLADPADAAGLLAPPF